MTTQNVYGGWWDTAQPYHCIDYRAPFGSYPVGDLYHAHEFYNSNGVIICKSCGAYSAANTPVITRTNTGGF